MKRLSEQQITSIIDLYVNQNITPTKIGEMFGIRDNSVTRIIKKHGLKRKTAIVSEDQIDQMVAEYMNGISSEVIAEKMGLNGSTIRRKLENRGVAIRPATQNKRRYKINESFFNTIDTEAKAYFLGFMLADGNMSKTGNGISITLEQEDIHILETFSDIIYGFHKLKRSTNILQDGNEGVYYTLSFYGQRIYQDLQKWGCTNAKSFTITFPQS